MSNWYDPGNGDFLAVDGHVVERDALHIAERIKEYDSNLEILCLDPQLADLNDAPFIICERLPNGTLSRVFECWELDERVIDRIARSDTVHNDVLVDLEGKELLQRVQNEKRYEEKRDANIDLVKTIARHTKSSFVFKNDRDEKVTLYDDRPYKKE